MKFVKKDEILAAEGDSDSTIFILMKGCISILKNDVEIARFTEKGTIIGEMSMILNSCRTATIKASEDSYVATISGTLDQIVKNFPEVSANIMANLAERLMKTTEGFCSVSEKLLETIDEDYSADNLHLKEDQMKTYTDYLWFKTSQKEELINITDNIVSVVDHCGISEGILTLFVMDSSSGIITLKNKEDEYKVINKYSDKTLPELKNEIVIPITKSRLELGSDQNIYFLELDGKQRKRISLKILGI